ncbi:type IX secretion system membrane protein PorP/SprF [Jiulongibacter sp. NS-SX5]|uniref:type IX secretion system membrane protein PorP/SprF n=1 Tax=Jiulongibacter sp. NS-SX5 TaxID=3463854 RepID=UPI00405A0A3C
MKHLFIVFTLISHLALAQIGLEDQYQFNFLAINPAFAGQRGNFGVTGMLGQQFNGTFRPNQVSQVISMDGKMGEGKSSIGFQGFRSTIMGFTNNGLILSFSHSIIENEEYKLLIGLNGGFLVSPNAVDGIDLRQRFNPFAGPGLVFMNDKLFAGVAAPTLLSNTNTYSTLNKNLKLSAGYRLGSYENIGVNISALANLATRARDVSGFDMNLKVWLGNKIGLGATLRNQRTYTGLIPNIQMRASETSTIGLSYESKPLGGYDLNSNSVSPRPVFQLVYRYDVFNIGEKSPFLNQF